MAHTIIKGEALASPTFDAARWVSAWFRAGGSYVTTSEGARLIVPVGDSVAMSDPVALDILSGQIDPVTWPAINAALAQEVAA